MKMCRNQDYKPDYQPSKTINCTEAEILHSDTGVINNNNCLSAKIQINGEQNQLTIDTGATVSLLRLDVAQHLRLEIKEERAMCLKTFDGSTLEMVGKCQALVQWRGKQSFVPFWVIKSPSTHAGLIGRDMLSQFGATISILNVEKQESAIRDIRVKLPLRENTKPVFRKARTVPWGRREAVAREIQ